MNAFKIQGDNALRPRTIFALAWFHAVVQERRIFIPQGWCKFYEFSDSDLKAGLQVRLKKSLRLFAISSVVFFQTLRSSISCFHGILVILIGSSSTAYLRMQFMEEEWMMSLISRQETTVHKS